jgi:hypothetical protein
MEPGAKGWLAWSGLPSWSLEARALLKRRGDCLSAVAALQWRMAISTNRENALEECKRHIDECAALLERTSVPEYREAIIAMGKAWMKIVETILSRRGGG